MAAVAIGTVPYSLPYKHNLLPAAASSVYLCECVDSLTWSSATLTLLRNKLITTEKNVVWPSPVGKTGAADNCPISVCHLTNTHTQIRKQTPAETETKLAVYLPSPPVLIFFPSLCWLTQQHKHCTQKTWTHTKRDKSELKSKHLINIQQVYSRQYIFIFIILHNRSSLQIHS